MEEAKLVQSEHGHVPEGEGWFVLNARDAEWGGSDQFGTYCTFEGDRHFQEYGIGLHVLQPGQPNGMYHGEDSQEDFLVLSGECILLIEGEERHLRAWDFVHCPRGAEHIFVGAGEGPCVILMAGARREGRPIQYPVSELAQRHGAGVETATPDAQEAYAKYDRPQPAPAPDFL